MPPFPVTDRETLRRLAHRVAEIAALPVQEERRRLWRLHNSLRPCRPMILVFPEGGWRELLPERALTCQDPRARRIEWDLRARIYGHEHIDSDGVAMRTWDVPKAIRDSGWGLEAQRRPAPTQLGAWHIEPVLHGAADLRRLRQPELTVDEAAGQAARAELQELFGDILDVRLRGRAHVSYHLMAHYTQLRGLEEAMLDMYENPGLIHDFMAFVTAGHERLLRQLQDLALLELNNDNTYHSSGGNGWTDELPRAGHVPGAPARPGDMWASAEAQELATVGPDQHAEFSLAYEKRLLAPFALTGYGCCEDLTRKLDLVLAIPGIRRLSISSWSDVAACAAGLAHRRAIFSWKPQPAHLVGTFNEPAIRAYIRRTLDACRAADCALEIILKDTHTCEGHPERFTRWAQIAREEVERAG